MSRPERHPESEGDFAHIRTLQVADIELPPEMERLRDLAYDLWWSWSPQATRLFTWIDPDHWRRYHKTAHPKPNGEMKEWRKIRDRLKDGYRIAQLCRAIDGMHKRPWNNGENPSGTMYLSLELCMRDGQHVEQYLEAMATHEAGGGVLSEKTQRGVRAVQSWAQRGQQQPPRIEQR